MVTFLTLILAIIIIGVVLTFLVGTGGITIFLIFGDVIIAGFVVYKIVRAILKKR